jgi:hypothetical protein
VCADPLTLTAIATVVSAGASVYQGYAAKQQGKYEQNVANANATMERDAAYDAQNRGKLEELARWRQVAQARSAATAAFAANGLDTTFGTPVDVDADSLGAGYQDAQTIRENYERETRGYLISSANYTAQGEAARARGDSAFTSSLFQAGGTILGSASSLSGMRTAQSSTVGGFGRSSSTGSNLPNSAFKW